MWQATFCCAIDEIKILLKFSSYFDAEILQRKPQKLGFRSSSIKMHFPQDDYDESPQNYKQE